MTSASDWDLLDFEDLFDAWAAEFTPSSELCEIVTTWAVARAINPYDDVEQDPGEPELWFGWIPGSVDWRGREVFCSYLIDPSAHTVTFQIIESRPRSQKT